MFIPATDFAILCYICFLFVWEVFWYKQSLVTWTNPSHKVRRSIINNYIQASNIRIRSSEICENFSVARRLFEILYNFTYRLDNTQLQIEIRLSSTWKHRQQYDKFKILQCQFNWFVTFSWFPISTLFSYIILGLKSSCRIYKNFVCIFKSNWTIRWIYSCCKITSLNWILVSQSGLIEYIGRAFFLNFKSDQSTAKYKHLIQTNFKSI